MEVMKKRIIIAVILVCMSLGSFFFVSNVVSNPDNHKTSIKVLDDKKATVLKLTALTTASSTAITMIPGDTATPIANKLADLTTWFLVVLCALFLEKYLLTITGLAAFKILIPLALILCAIWIFYPKDFIYRLAVKMGVFGICIFLAIPTSVQITSIIENTYEESIQTTIEEAEATNDAIENEAKAEQTKPADDTDNKSIWQSITDSGKELVNNVVSWGSDKVKEYTTKAQNTLNNFIEATAVMLITSCVIPLLVIVFYLWLMNVILGININISNKIKLPKLDGGKDK